MWETDSLWFDVAIVMSIFAVGTVLFGRFVQHEPRWRRVLKQVIVLAVVLLLDITVGRPWAFGVLAVPLLAAAYVHLRWLPRHGINGWTAEPYDKYLALITKRGGRTQPPG